MACKGCTPIIGVDSQPISSFAGWKALGINTLFRENLEGHFTQAQWRAAAVAAGLKYVAVPSTNLAADAADPNLLAWCLPDEPDYHNWPVSQWSNVYNACRAVSTTKPIFGNFAGDHVTAAMKETPPYNGSKHIPFMPFVDWIGNDWYPINRNVDRYWTAFNGPGLITSAMTLLSKWSGGKPQFAYVECGDINISATGRSPTELEMKTIVRAIMARQDALGYIFFPIREAGDRGRGSMSWSADDTTPTMKTAISEINTEMMPAPVEPTVVMELLSNNTWRLKA